MRLRLISVVLHHGKPLAEVIVEDTQGHRRKIEYSWLTKDDSDSLPGVWVEAVEGEVEFQRSEEAAEASSRRIPY